MIPRFHLDQDVFSKLKGLLNALYGDPDCARTAMDLGMHRALDGRHLLAAAQGGRIFVTHNAKDFITIHDAWVQWTAAWGVDAVHAGILIIPQVWGPERSATEISQFLGSRTTLPNEIHGYNPHPTVNRWVQDPSLR